MAEPITMQKLIDSSMDSDTLGEFANEDKMVTARLGREYPSAPMAARLLVENGLLGARPFPTYAKMTAPDVDPPLADGDYAVVTNDDEINKNGVYQKIGANYIYQKYNPVSSKTISADGISIAIVDNNDNQTWLQASSEDGGLTEVSEQAIRDKLDVYKKEDTPSIFAVIDPLGNLTDLQLDSNGEIPDAVIASWKTRMGAYSKVNSNILLELTHEMPIIQSTQTSLHPSDVYYKDGELLPVTPDINKVILTGSSSALRFKDYARVALQALNPTVDFYSTAFGGAVIEQQSAMLGNTPLKIKFANNIINKTGDTPVTVLSDVVFENLMNNLAGWASGVKGKLKIVGSGVVFERTNTASVDDIVNDSIDFIPEKANEYRNAIQIMWVGKNNLTDSNSVINDVDKLIDNTNSIIQYNASLVKRCIVMTHYVDTNTVAGSATRARINRCNQMYKILYKSNVFDVEPILLGNQIFTDLGITRTATDIAQQNLGNLPPSLAIDSQHLTLQAYEYIAQKLAQFINSKNFFGA